LRQRNASTGLLPLCMNLIDPTFALNSVPPGRDNARYTSSSVGSNVR